MATRNFKKRPSSSYEPKAVGAILDEMLRSESRFAVAYRNHFYPDTHLDVDLKLISREPARMPVGAYLDGVITRDGEDHFCFIQNDDDKKRLVVTQRNPHVYLGKRFNVNRKDDGSLYPTFNRPRYISFKNFCLEAAEELIAVAGLVGEE
jgi:hypothetical protein